MDLYCIKGRILQAAGDWNRGQELFEEARILDQADRALNALSAKQMIKVDKIDESEATMNIFFKACGYETGVHEVQTMWFESNSGKSHQRTGKMMEALKSFNHIERHIEAMTTGQYEYYLYAMRKFALKGFEEMVEFTDTKLIQNKYVSRAALGYLQIEKKLASKKAELAQAQKQITTDYLAGEEHKAVLEACAKKNDDNEYRNDSDPSGYKLYQDYLDGKFDIGAFVERVIKKNWQDPALHAKAIPYFLSKGKLDSLYS